MLQDDYCGNVDYDYDFPASQSSFDDYDYLSQISTQHQEVSFKTQKQTQLNKPIKQIRIKSIQSQRQLLLLRLKQLDQQQQSLGVQRSKTPPPKLNNNTKQKIVKSSTKQKNKKKADDNILKQNPFTTELRAKLTKNQQSHLQRLDFLDQAQLALTMKQFGLKKMSKNQMKRQLQKIKNYMYNIKLAHPFISRVTK